MGLDPDKMVDDLADGANIAGFFQRQQANQQQAETNRLLQEQQAERKRVAALPDCPYCGSKIPKVGAKICSQCKEELAWAGHFVCEPKNIARTKTKYENYKKAMRLPPEIKRLEKKEAAARSKLEKANHNLHLAKSGKQNLNYFLRNREKAFASFKERKSDAKKNLDEESQARHESLRKMRTDRLLEEGLSKQQIEKVELLDEIPVFLFLLIGLGIAYWLCGVSSFLWSWLHIAFTVVYVVSMIILIHRYITCFRSTPAHLKRLFREVEKFLEPQKKEITQEIAKDKQEFQESWEKQKQQLDESWNAKREKAVAEAAAKAQQRIFTLSNEIHEYVTKLGELRRRYTRYSNMK